MSGGLGTGQGVLAFQDFGSKGKRHVLMRSSQQNQLGEIDSPGPAETTLKQAMVASALKKLRQEDHEHQGSLDYVVRLPQKHHHHQ